MHRSWGFCCLLGMCLFSLLFAPRSCFFCWVVTLWPPCRHHVKVARHHRMVGCIVVRQYNNQF
ncbi:hypothetical protein I3760_01G296900 [Carya illinoinensis]|nr:hypothetical protein I3760_01G296900 [Carya illinoinensis]